MDDLSNRRRIGRQLDAWWSRQCLWLWPSSSNGLRPLWEIVICPLWEVVSCCQDKPIFFEWWRLTGPIMLVPHALNNQEGIVRWSRLEVYGWNQHESNIPCIVRHRPWDRQTSWATNSRVAALGLELGSRPVSSARAFVGFLEQPLCFHIW